MKRHKNISIWMGACALALACAAAQAAPAVEAGDCVYPKTTQGKGGGLVLKRSIELRGAPSLVAPNPKYLNQLRAFAVKKRVGDFILLETTPDHDAAEPSKSAGKAIGWALASSFDPQEPRNCH
jgi:hypothetical protein